MSLRFALLGLLNEHPSSGYDLTRRFSEGIGAYAWDAKHSQIYPELRKLTEDGLIKIAEEGARGRKTYAITEQGRQELRGWLLSPPTVAGGVRNEYVLRLFLLSALDQDEARQILTHTIEHSTRQRDAIDAEYQEHLAGRGAARHGALAAQYGIRMYQATIEWAQWAIEQLTAETAPRSGN